ncbi:Neurochondrin-domain-containing protein [Geopyxis carbonaria]|nr:Neurochondrin-domain-containing protein [Geopyxis carbonaria]
MSSHAKFDISETLPSTVEECLNLLARKDDTSRFVGLALLLSLTNHVQSSTIMQRCSEVMDGKFLDRLLKTKPTSRQPSAETSALHELATSVTFAFASSLHDAPENDFVIGRAPSLIQALCQSTPKTISTILQTLLIISTGSNGSRSILETKDLTPITDALLEHSEVADIILHLFLNPNKEEDAIAQRLKALLFSICERLGDCTKKSSLSILSLLVDVIPLLPAKVTSYGIDWLALVYKYIRAITLRGPSLEERKHCTFITAQLLDLFPGSLFFAADDADKQESNKPFSYIFIQLVIIDAQAAFSTLVEQINSPLYPDLVRRQASCFDIIVAYLTFLSNASSLSEIGLEPSLLLRTRNDIGETFKLSLEFLQDVWHSTLPVFADGAIKSEEEAHATCSVLPSKAYTNSLVTSIVRALSLWLQEDDSLRKEAACVVGLLLDLWKTSDAGIEVKSWIVAALDGITEETPGRKEFLDQGGCEILWNDIKFTHEKRSQATEADVHLSIEEARLLSSVVHAEKIANIDWAREVIRTIGPTSVKTDKTYHVKLKVELCILGTGCVTTMSHTDQKALSGELTQLRNAIEGLQSILEDGAGSAVFEDWMAESLRDANQVLQRQ